MPPRTPQHIREAAVADYLAGESCNVVGRRYGVSSTAVCKWAIRDHGYLHERVAHPMLDGAPEVYEGGWVSRGGVMYPLEPVREAS